VGCETYQVFLLTEAFNSCSQAVYSISELTVQVYENVTGHLMMAI